MAQNFFSQSLKIIGLFLISYLLTGVEAFGSFADLLNSRTRPTMAEVEREVALQSHFPAIVNLNVVTYLTSESHYRLIAQAIAELEWVFPDAIFMPLGRDVVAIGDVMDAFYHAHGQYGRVKRLDASGQSLRNSGHLIVRFIESSGVDLNNLRAGPTYVFFDASSYGFGSQSTTILRAVYDEYRARGGDATDLPSKFAFVNLVHGTKKGWVIGPYLDRNVHLRSQRADVSYRNFGIPKSSFGLSETPYGSSEWHSNFLPLKIMPDGSVEAPAPIESSDGILVKRQGILSEMVNMMTAVREPFFLEAIQARARGLGYEFPIIPSDRCLTALEKQL